MSDHDEVDGLVDPAEGQEEPPEQTGIETVESYEVDNGVVFYDAENPLAWVRASCAVKVRK